MDRFITHHVVLTELLPCYYYSYTLFSISADTGVTGVSHPTLYGYFCFRNINDIKIFSYETLFLEPRDSGSDREL